MHTSTCVKTQVKKREHFFKKRLKISGMVDEFMVARTNGECCCLDQVWQIGNPIALWNWSGHVQLIQVGLIVFFPRQFFSAITNIQISCQWNNFLLLEKVLKGLAAITTAFFVFETINQFVRSVISFIIDFFVSITFIMIRILLLTLSTCHVSPIWVQSRSVFIFFFNLFLPTKAPGISSNKYSLVSLEFTKKMIFLFSRDNLNRKIDEAAVVLLAWYKMCHATSVSPDNSWAVAWKMTHSKTHHLSKLFMRVWFLHDRYIVGKLSNHASRNILEIISVHSIKLELFILQNH